MTNSTSSKVHPWIMFVGVLLLIAGIYGTVRTAVNLLAFDKYPTQRVFSFTFFRQDYGYPGPREIDCTYPRIYYRPDGVTIRKPTEQEKQFAEQEKAHCIAGVEDARRNAKVADISESLLLLALGSGILATRRIFFLKDA